MKATFLALVILAHASFGSDVDGRWRADSTFPKGTQVIEYFDLKAEGAELHGSFTDAFGGKHELRDGKIRGHEISFWMLWEKTDKCQVTGIIREQTIEFRMVTPAVIRTAVARRLP